MGHARAIVFAGSAGRWVTASWACCGPGEVPAGGEWRFVAGVYRFHGGGGAISSGVGWARGRLPAGSGCRGLTVGGSSAVSPWCVPWWSLVGWLKGVYWGVPHPWGHHCVLGRRSGWCGGLWGWGLCRRRPCGSRRCVVRRPRRLPMVVCCGGAWGVVLGLAVPGRVRDMRGRVGLGGGARVGLRVCLLLSSRSLPLPFPCSSLFAGLFGSVFFWGGGGWAAVRGCGGVPVPAPVWVWVSWGTGVGWLLRSGFPVCAPAPGLPVPGAPVRGALTAGGWRQWWGGACVGGRGSWVVPGWRGRAWACVWVCSWRGLMGWWAVWAWLVCVGVGYVCAEGAVGWAGALWAMQWVEEMLVIPTGGCCGRRNGFVLLTWVLRVMRRAATGLVTLMVS